MTASRETSRDQKGGVRLDAVDLSTGKTRWSKFVDATPRLRHLASRADGVVVISADGRVRAFSLADGEPLLDTMIAGGVETLFGTDPIIEGDRLYAILRTGPSTVISAFDLTTGRALWTVPTRSPVNTGWMRKDGGLLVTIQTPHRRPRASSSSHLIALVDANTGEVVHRIDGEGLSGWQPSATIVDGTLVVGGERAFAAYR